ncbi:MAG: Ig-like domain-containing protein [Saprospiraceae bacterium]|nr:Ig-like domain-containing protein [Saprospiraceae bacterium]
MRCIRFVGILVCLLSASCANIKGITGGPDDKTAPALRLDISSPNFQKNFKDRQIILGFNEWIRLDNPSTNISISPTLQYLPEFKLKGKRLIISFDEREILKENTTYSIQFGESIKDITAGNIQRDLRYIFSTGDFIDSLSISGIVKNAFTREAKEKLIVGLYKNLDDTAFQKTKPFYFTWTDTAGKFSLENLSPGNYKLYALEDKNQNYFYDQTSESFAFLNDPIQIEQGKNNYYFLNLSIASIPVFIKERFVKPGIIKFLFNEKPASININCERNSDYIKAVDLDSLLIWNKSRDSLNCILDFGFKKDTFFIPPLNDISTISSRSLILSNNFVKPTEWPAFIFDFPIEKIIPEKIYFLDSTVSVTSISYDTIDPRKFYIQGNFNSKKESKVIFSEGAIEAWFNAKNKLDTFRINYIEKASLSRLKLAFDSLQIGYSYIFQLITNTNVALEKHFIPNTTSQELVLTNIFPGNYKVRLIHDQNNNKKWDPGNYTNKTQAEVVWYFGLPELRADWDIDVKLKP